MNEPSDQQGSLRPTSPLVLAALAAVGGAVGWAVPGLYYRFNGVPPLVTWVQAAAFYLIAGILGWTAWTTHRALQVRRERWSVENAVNRLVLARASALVCAVVGAGYLGYGLRWISGTAEKADARLVHSLVAAGGGLLAVVAALFLERACRVSGPSDRD